MPIGVEKDWGGLGDVMVCQELQISRHCHSSFNTRQHGGFWGVDEILPITKNY